MTRQQTPKPASRNNKQAEPAIQNDRVPSHMRDDDSRPTGLPNSDRHAMETVHSWEDEEQ
jgi:hypothetical protein